MTPARLLLYIVAALLILAAPPQPARAEIHTENVNWMRNPFARDRNPARPRTVSGVYRAYRSFVMPHNGIDRREARIIAQYRLIEDHRQTAYDFRKPKVVGETGEYFDVRFPGKFSIMSKKVNIFHFHIAKADGAILAAYEANAASFHY